VVGSNPIGVLHDDLREACIGALRISKDACRAFALTHSWENSARQFIGHLSQVVIGGSRKPRTALAIEAHARG